MKLTKDDKMKYLVVEYSMLAKANTTKPLQHRNGLVVLAFANKSGVPRVLGWPGDHLFSSIQFSPRTPPSLELAMLANRESAGKYYTKTCYYCGST